MAREPARTLLRRFLPGLLLLFVGGVVLGLAGGTAVVAAGMVLAGLGGIWLVSAAFFTVGHSEDVDRRRRPRG